MKKNLLALVTISSLAFTGAALVACSGDDNSGPPPASGTDAGHDSSLPVVDSGPGNDANGNTDTGPTGNPTPPTLGTQVDRMGRPAVNTALNHGFDGNATTAGAAKDAYNADTNVSTWAASYVPQFEGNLAILDSLDKGALPNDGGGCGNQPFANPDAGGPDRYATLASVLAADMLWMDTSQTTCSQYLGVELKATGVITTSDCGGRALPYDVIQTTYSIVSGVGITGFGSGVSAVPSKVNGTTFPYLAPPQ
jgi:hypothetical protein